MNVKIREEREIIKGSKKSLGIFTGIIFWPEFLISGFLSGWLYFYESNES